MPFKSEAQRRFLWAKHPEVARKWANEEKKMDPLKKTAVRYGRPKKKRGSKGSDRVVATTAENRRPARAKFHSYTQPKLGGHIPYWLRNKRKKSGPGHP